MENHLKNGEGKMHIAVATEGKDLNSKVSQQFNTCDCLLIVNLDNLNVHVINNEGNDFGEKLANEVVKYNCEAIITGKLSSIAFDILADACVTRYLGVGNSAKHALDLMEKNQLNCIKNHDGTNDCKGNHHH